MKCINYTHGSFYIHHSIFSDGDNSSWRLDGCRSIDSTVYPLLTLFNLLKNKPFQKVSSTLFFLDYVTILYQHTSLVMTFIFTVCLLCCINSVCVCFNQADFTPAELDSRKRLLNLEVCMIVLILLFIFQYMH